MSQVLDRRDASDERSSIRAVRPTFLNGRQRLARASMVGAAATAAYQLPKALLDLDGPPICVFRHVTGLPCPLCGGTHAMNHVMNLDLAQAVDANAGVTLLALGAGMWALASVWEAVCGRPLLTPTTTAGLRRAAPTLGAAVLVAAWVPRLIGGA